MIARCPHTVHWWDIDTTVRCIRDGGHAGDHTDGDRWWDDCGIQTPRDPDDRRPFFPSAKRGRHPRASLTDDEVRDIRRRRTAGFTIAEIARDMALNYNIVYHCVQRVTYRDVA